MTAPLTAPQRAALRAAAAGTLLHNVQVGPSQARTWIRSSGRTVRRATVHTLRSRDLIELGERDPDTQHAAWRLTYAGRALLERIDTEEAP